MTPVFISPTGEVRLLYSEDVALHDLGDGHVRRASHVDPDGNGNWWADLSPVHGPRVGPFACRSQALAAETAWLIDRWLPAGGPAPDVISHSI
jgi:hypothetical protein